MTDAPANADDFAPPLRATHHCRHYSYMRSPERGRDGPRCGCGIDLREKPGMTLRCMPDGTRDVALLAQGNACEPCAWREEYTDDERAAWKAWMAKRLERTALAMAVIPGDDNAKKDRQFWGKQGTVECPACKTGLIRWSRSRVNGHIWAGCSTPNCFEIMQ